MASIDTHQLGLQLKQVQNRVKLAAEGIVSSKLPINTKRVRQYNLVFTSTINELQHLSMRVVEAKRNFKITGNLAETHQSLATAKTILNGIDFRKLDAHLLWMKIIINLDGHPMDEYFEDHLQTNIANFLNRVN